MNGRILRGAGRKRTPVILVAGIDEAAMMTTTLSLALGLPGAVSVRHVIDLARQTLTRTVSDVTGMIEREEMSLEHACVACAIREDIVPTLERLAGAGRWDAIVACLPVGAEAVQVCRVLAWAPRSAPHVEIAGVVAALDGTTLAGDLLGGDLLMEHGLQCADDDERGVAEVACAITEYADLISLTDTPTEIEESLLRTLIRPGAMVQHDPSAIDGLALTAGVHHHSTAESWVAPVRFGDLPPAPSGAAWRIDLRSDRPFHPDRFQEEIENLGSGPRRSRGCFWLPTRPGDICVWDGAGGQASVGSTDQWAPKVTPLTRIVVTGLDDGARDVQAAFERSLVTEAELRSRGRFWDESFDGLEPWLGPIDRVA